MIRPVRDCPDRMEGDAEPPLPLEFADCSLDVGSRTLCRGGEPVGLEPKVLDLLLYLARHAGRLVSRETLEHELWPDVSVSDTALARLVKEARRAVGDTGRRQGVIETRRGRGFRLVATVRERSGDEVPYVGRPALLRKLDRLIDDACAGRGRILLLAGEPGMGKTRTAEEFAQRGRQRGTLVATAWGAEGIEAPDYWPWIQVLRGLTRSMEPEALRRALGPSAHVIAPLVPELLEHAPGRAPPRMQGDAERFRLFDAVCGVLGRCARQRPLVLGFDDLHRADAQSLALLDLVDHQLPGERIAVLATFREPELARRPSLADALSQLARRPGVEVRRLEGLSADETRSFIEHHTGLAPETNVAERLRERTEGSPLFLAEVVGQTLEETPDARDAARWEELAARGLSSVIARRLGSLSPEALHALRRGAAMGREFERGLLAQVLETPPASLEPALEEARAARVVTRGARLAPTWRFSHVLFRDALYAQLDPAERRAAHVRIADVLEATQATTADPDLDRLADHVHRALPDIGAGRAIGIAERAGQRAFRVNAFEAAIRHYGRAVTLLDEQGAADPQRVCGLLLALGEAQRLVGEREGSRDAFRRAARLAREASSPIDLARAALGFAGFYAYGPPDPEVVSLLEEAANALRAPDEALRARLLGRLASELTLDPEGTRRAELRRAAWASANISGDMAAIVELAAHPDHGIWDAMVEPSKRLDLARSYVERCRTEGLPLFELAARLLRLDELLRRGEVDAFDAERAQTDRLSEEIRDPRALWARRLQQFSRALLSGDLDQAERIGQEAHRFARRHLDPRAAYAVWGRQLAVLRAEQGRLHELKEAWGRICDAAPTVSNRALHGWICAADGDELATRRILRQLCAARCEALASHPMSCANAAVLADACSRFGIGEHVEPLLSVLRPYAGLCAIRTYAVCHGPVDHFRGLLEELRGGVETALPCFEAAARLSERMGAQAWAARSRERALRARTASR